MWTKFLIALTVVFVSGLIPAYSQEIASVDDILGLEKVRDLNVDARGIWFSPDGESVVMGNLQVINTRTWSVEPLLHTTNPRGLRPLGWIGDDTVIAASSTAPLLISLSGRSFIEQADLTLLQSKEEFLRNPVAKKLGVLNGLVVVDATRQIARWDEVQDVNNPLVSTSGRFVMFSGTFGQDLHSNDPVKYPASQGLFLWERSAGRLVVVSTRLSEQFIFSPDERWIIYEKTGYRNIPDEPESQRLSSVYIRKIENLELGEEKQLDPESPGTLQNLGWSSNGLICFGREISPLGFYRLKLVSPLGHTRTETE